MNNKLSFIGTGGAFSIINTNNSAYCKIDDRMVLFDCGETVFHEIIKNNIITDDINKIDIIITHCHSDHIGSLGSLIFYCSAIEMDEINVIFPEKDIIKNFLDIIGIEEYLYKLKKPFEINTYYLKEYNQIHGDVDEQGRIIPMPAYGYHFKCDDYNFFFSGDTCKMNQDVLDMFINNEIDILYHEVSTDGYPAHIQLNELEKLISYEYRDKVYCMHMKDDVDIGKIKKLGFKSVR